MNLSNEYMSLIEIAEKAGEPIRTDEAHVIVHANNIIAAKDIPVLKSTPKRLNLVLGHPLP
ncbi:MAG: hypothetical protein ABC360_09210 [Acetomicrobium sp.]